MNPVNRGIPASVTVSSPKKSFACDGIVIFSHDDFVIFPTDTMNDTIRIPLVLGLAVGLQIPASAGSETPAAAASAPSNSGDWCEWLESKPGTLYKNPDNWFLQYFNVGGRFQYQAAYVDGEDVNGRDFNDTYDDYRRVRFESNIEFLRYFGAEIKINMVNDGRPSGGDLDWGYDSFDEAIFSFDIGKAFGAGPFDSLKLNYGRFKVNMTEEVRMSSKEILTIERSAIANKLYGVVNRATGVTLDAELGKWFGTFGVFSSEDDSEFIGGWNDGIAYYLSLQHQTTDEWRLVLDLMSLDKSGTDNNLGYDWAAAFNAIYEKDRVGLLSTLVAGENSDTAPGRGGSFQGLVVMPWYWIVEEKLQAVLQYQFSGAGQSEGIRTNSRYVRAEHSPVVDVNDGRGDELHTVLLGLNYYFCGHRTKIMSGIEYSSLDTPAGNVNALTYLIGFRGYF